MSGLTLAQDEQALIGVRLVTYLSVSSCALLVHDYLLTLSDEIALVWHTPWNKSKVLFYLTRYLVFFDMSLILLHQFGENMSIELCKRVYQVSTFSIEGGIVIAEVALVVRTWALWGRGRYIGWFLTILVIGCATPAIVFVVKYVRTLSFIPASAISPKTTGCVVTIQKDHTLWISFLFLSIFEIVILLLTLGTRLHRLHQPLSSLAQMMYQDGIIYFVYLFAISTANVVLFLHAPLLYALILIPMQRVLHGIMSARILLNLRKYGRSTTYQSDISTIRVRQAIDVMVHHVTEISKDSKMEEFEMRVPVAKVQVTHIAETDSQV